MTHTHPIPASTPHTTRTRTPYPCTHQHADHLRCQRCHTHTHAQLTTTLHSPSAPPTRHTPDVVIDTVRCAGRTRLQSVRLSVHSVCRCGRCLGTRVRLWCMGFGYATLLLCEERLSPVDSRLPPIAECYLFSPYQCTMPHTQYLSPLAAPTHSVCFCPDWSHCLYLTAVPLCQSVSDCTERHSQHTRAHSRFYPFCRHSSAL